MFCLLRPVIFLGGKFEIRKSFVRVILAYAKPIVEAIPQVVPESSGKILQLFCDNSHMTIPELSAELGISTRAIEKNIQALQSNGQLQRVGGAKGGLMAGAGGRS